MADTLQAVRLGLYLLAVSVSICAPRSRLYRLLFGRGLAFAGAALVHVIALAITPGAFTEIWQVLWDTERLESLLPHLHTPTILVAFLSDNDLATYSVHLIWNAFALRKGVWPGFRVGLFILALFTISGAALVALLWISLSRWRISIEAAPALAPTAERRR